VISLPA
jgi:hypothetical protein